MPPAKRNPSKGKSKAAAARAVDAAGKPPAAPRNIAAVLGRKASRKAAREMLLLETRRLRAMFSEIAEHYVANTEGKIASAVDAIEARTLPAETIGGMLKVLRDLAVKPQKGRRKDLSRIEKAAETLLKALE
ncbi:MAG TPA: hypothetical protein VN450_07175 [Candidatus Methylomirabilis sp.]|nr:hypothetical protein [Candidatus Methylomirabilis sp.]